MAEQNNELLMKNHESRPTGSAPFPEANATTYENSKRGHGRTRGRGRGRSRGHGRGHGWNKYQKTIVIIQMHLITRSG